MVDSCLMLYYVNDWEAIRSAFTIKNSAIVQTAHLYKYAGDNVDMQGLNVLKVCLLIFCIALSRQIPVFSSHSNEFCLTSFSFILFFFHACICCIHMYRLTTGRFANKEVFLYCLCNLFHW